MSKSLYLIDGFAQIFRAYYAIRGGMTSPVTGEPTHAVFGFTGMLIKLFSQFKPDYIVVALDAPGDTFRDEMFEAYKATREKTPEDLTAQIPRVIELIESFGIPTIGVEGLEADDIIATITDRVLSDPDCADVQIRIVSRDKDLEQLLSDRVTMIDIHKDTVIDVETLKKEKGITPDQVIDVLALMGDKADNVPGVPGIGPKTAAELVQTYGSIDGILENLDQIKGKRRENLEAAKETLALSRQLVTLKRDADVPFSLEAARVRPLQLPRLLRLFHELGFNRYQREVRRLVEEMDWPVDEESDNGAAGEAAEKETGPEAERGEYELVCTEEELDELVQTLRRQKRIAVDTETTGLERDAELCGICLAWKPGHGVYVPIRSPEPERCVDLETVTEKLGPILEDPEVEKCGHNIKFDALALRRAGIVLRGVVFDSMLASMLLEPGQAGHKLDELAARLLNYKMISIESLIGDGEEQAPMDAVPLEQIAPYAAEDADVVMRLYEALAPRLEEAGMAKLLEEVEAPLALVLAEMETHGILLDPQELQRQGEALAERVEELRAEILEIAGVEFHLDSPKQLAEVLFERLGLPPGKKTKTGYSTDIEVLTKLAAEEDASDPRTSVPRLIIEYRQLTKLISTYIGTLQEAVRPETGRIHSTFHQLVTATGRLASHNPNLQNIPVRTDVGRQIRKAFLAPPGHVLICADYSQIELRMLAHLSEDPGLISAFQQDLDIHAAVASQVFGTPIDAVSRRERDQAKTINFGIIYGITPYGLSRRIPGLDVKTAAKLIDDYKARFPGIDAFLQRCIQQALDDGYVTTILGRRRSIPEIRSPNRARRSHGERLAINSVVQGSAADLIKAAMVNMQRRIDEERLPLKLLLQIHDELVFEAPEAEAEELAGRVLEVMEGAMDLKVPLKAEAGIGKDWMSAK